MCRWVAIAGFWILSAICILHVQYFIQLIPNTELIELIVCLKMACWQLGLAGSGCCVVQKLLEELNARQNPIILVPPLGLYQLGYFIYILEFSLFFFSWMVTQLFIKIYLHKKTITTSLRPQNGRKWKTGPTTNKNNQTARKSYRTDISPKI